MKISLATNFDDNLIDLIKEYNIYEVYGKLKSDIIGGGRPTNYLKDLDYKKFEDHVKKVRSNGINFNYLLNSARIANLNQSKEWVKQFTEFLVYLKNVGVNALTVTNPYLVEIIKKFFKEDFIIRVSSFACIDCYEKAKFWDDLGVDIICVDFCKVNRNFAMLEYMVKNLNCKIELLCTNSCLKDCPMIHTHVNDISHASNKIFNQEDYEDWGLNFCQFYQLQHLEEYIKSPWVRPEDIDDYLEIGIEHFKITERDFSTEYLVKRVKAYSSKKYEGNLLDLIQGSGFESESDLTFKKIEPTNRNDIMKEIKAVRGIGCKRKLERHVFIDNQKIPKNFIKHFKNHLCTGYCKDCNFCKSISDKSITKNDEVYNYLVDLYKNFNYKKY